MSIFVSLPEDPDPDLPDRLLKALIRAARRRTLSPTAKKRAKPYARRARELLTSNISTEGAWK